METDAKTRLGLVGAGRGVEILGFRGAGRASLKILVKNKGRDLESRPLAETCFPEIC
jgi:hypothetical protein